MGRRQACITLPVSRWTQRATSSSRTSTISSSVGGGAHENTCDPLAARGQQGAGSALFAATAALLKRAQFPRYWPFPPKRGFGLLTESADELEVGDIWLPKQDSNA